MPNSANWMLSKSGLQNKRPGSRPSSRQHWMHGCQQHLLELTHTGSVCVCVSLAACTSSQLTYCQAATSSLQGAITLPQMSRLHHKHHQQQQHMTKDLTERAECLLCFLHAPPAGLLHGT